MKLSRGVPSLLTVPILFVILGVAMLVPPAGVAQQNVGLTLQAPNAVAVQQFTDVVAVRELADGRTLLADRSENLLAIVDWDSGTTTPIGRVGDGPAEYRLLEDLFPLQGDSTLVVDPQSDRWLLLDGSRIVDIVTSGDPLNQLLSILSGGDSAGHLLGVRGYGRSGAYASVSTADSLLLLLADRGFGYENGGGGERIRHHAIYG